MIIITKYQLKADGESIDVKCREATRCPQCGNIMSGYDHRKRMAKNSRGETVAYKLHRAKCLHCGMVHLLLPSFMHPYKHYMAAVIKNAIVDASDCPAEDSTIRRWKATK